MISLSDISKTYSNGAVALKNVSFEVPQGQFCVLLGHSGAGKSTILRLVNGLVQKTTGTICVNGTEINQESIKDIRRKVSMIHQDFNLFPRSSVATNVMAGAIADVPIWRALAGWFPSHIRKKCCEMVELVGLDEEHIHRRVSELSGGQQQRVGIARSLMLNPNIILADEPVASLDPSASREVLRHLRDIATDKNCTILCCLHQVDLAREFGDRIIGVEGGEIVFDLMPDDIDEDVLSLIYKNYDDPHGVNIVKSSRLENAVKTLSR